MTSEFPSLPSVLTHHPILADLGQCKLPARCVELARQTLTDVAQVPVDTSQFLPIAESALRAVYLIFCTALDEPEETELDVFFETFVRTRVGGDQ
jgi:hypothetical protein